MNGIDAVTHRRIWDCLPWIANGSANVDQRRDVDAHLPGCTDCRDELALQRQIHAAMNAEHGGGDADASLARLFARIDIPANPHGLDRYDGIDDEPFLATPSTRRPWRKAGWRIAAASVVVAQSVGLVVMTYRLQQAPAPDLAATAAYRTLSSLDTVSSAATIRFVPAPELSVQALQELLDDAGLRIVDSRARTAIYGLAPTGSDRSAATTAAAIARLRGKPGVLLVEPIGGLAAPSPR